MSTSRLLPALAVAACAACGSARSYHRDGGLGGTPLQDVPIEEVPVRGHAVEVETSAETFSGELLAVDARAVWILDAKGRTIAVERAQVLGVSIEMYASGAAGTWAWTALGTLSTLSHGFLAIYTAPIWVLLGTTATVAAARGNDRDVNPSNFDVLFEYARFPQGLPPEWPRPAGSPAAAPVEPPVATPTATPPPAPLDAPTARLAATPAATP
jgi:hypothetical protein